MPIQMNEKIWRDGLGKCYKSQSVVESYISIERSSNRVNVPFSDGLRKSVDSHDLNLLLGTNGVEEVVEELRG